MKYLFIVLVLMFATNAVFGDSKKEDTQKEAQKKSDTSNDDLMKITDLDSNVEMQDTETESLNMEEFGSFSITGAKKNRCKNIYSLTYKTVMQNKKITETVKDRFKASKDRFMAECLVKDETELMKAEDDLRAVEAVGKDIQLDLNVTN